MMMVKLPHCLVSTVGKDAHPVGLLEIVNPRSAKLLTSFSGTWAVEVTALKNLLIY